MGKGDDDAANSICNGFRTGPSGNEFVGCTLTVDRIDARLYDTLQFDLGGTGSVDSEKDTISDDLLTKMKECLGHPAKHTTDNGRDYITIEGKGLNVCSLGEFQACFMSRSAEYRIGRA